MLHHIKKCCPPPPCLVQYAYPKSISFTLPTIYMYKFSMCIAVSISILTNQIEATKVSVLSKHLIHVKIIIQFNPTIHFTERALYDLVTPYMPWVCGFRRDSTVFCTEKTKSLIWSLKTCCKMYLDFTDI